MFVSCGGKGGRGKDQAQARGYIYPATCGCSGLNHAGCAAAPRPPSMQHPSSRSLAPAPAGAPKEAPGALKFELCFFDLTTLLKYPVVTPVRC